MNFQVPELMETALPLLLFNIIVILQITLPLQKSSKVNFFMLRYLFGFILHKWVEMSLINK